MTDDTTGADLLRAAGLMPDGPGVLGRPIRASGAGVYVVELVNAVPRAPIDAAAVGKWIERVPTLLVDGERPTFKTLMARLAAFWLPSSRVVFVGSSDSSIGGRILALERQILGDRRPYPSSQWLKTLRVDGMRVYWAATAAPEEYEDGLLEAFGKSVPAEERDALFDPSIVLPFANLRTPTGGRKRTGITGSVLADDTSAPGRPTHVVDVPPGDAIGVPAARGSGTVRRTNTSSPPAAGARTPRARTPAGRSTAGSPPRPARLSAAATRAAGPPKDPVHLTPDGHAKLQAEHEELTQVTRPTVVDRIARARELGDLKENAEYHAARAEQSFLEGRIQAIEAQLRAAVIVETPTDVSRVGLGSRVTMELDGDEYVYEVVGSAESNPGGGKISSASPVGQALLGRSVGQEAVVKTPRGEVRYRIVAIE